jgi:hypothetical protein
VKFTAQQITFDLAKHHPDILALYKVNAPPWLGVITSRYSWWRMLKYGFVIMKNHIHLIWQGTNPAGDNTRPAPPIYYR